jgi:phospholipase C
VIRFLEQRFGVREPNIAPWRRAVCGDLLSAFDFKRPNDARNWAPLPPTAALSARAAALHGETPAVPPARPQMPVQASGPRRSRALPYMLEVSADVSNDRVRLTFDNSGRAAAVFHVYDRLHRDRTPRRYTVGPGGTLTGDWHGARENEPYDLWILGPNGLHRHVMGVMNAAEVQISMRSEIGHSAIALAIANPGRAARRIEARPMAYGHALSPRSFTLAPGQSAVERWSVSGTGGWYDIAVQLPAEGHYLRRFAGRLETGRDSIADPAMGGAALLVHQV